MEEIVYLNGSLVPCSKACISVSDHGFLYGYGLFETMRAYHVKIFLLERHLRRLCDAAEIIGMGPKLAGLDLAQACRETMKANHLTDARVRLTVTNGAGTALPWADAGGAATVVVTARAYTPFPARKYDEGFKVGIASVRRSRQSVVSSLKSINYLLSVMARKEAAGWGLDEALLLNDEGYIAEGGSSNVFFVREGRLITPALNSGIIPGVTRQLVMEIAGSLGIAVSEGPVGIGVLKKCDEAFVTNSIIEIMPLAAVRDKDGAEIAIGKGQPGEVTHKLMAAYQERVAKETAT